jgi:acyl transferase domain-containing protein/surfactin synthase thioesterase subunit/acyl carrier protein
MLKEIEQEDYATLLRRSLATIKRLKAELDQQTKKQEPIAIIGMGCRFPGGCHDPETFWKFLTEGGDGIIEVPRDRWNIEDLYDPDPNATGKIYLKEAGFLQENVGEFDARFFGISPREAVEMDPQQRLLLEVSWEALERAGIPAHQLKGTQTGVFIGIIGSEYTLLPRANSDISPYTLTGSMLNIASGRISYTLGVHGPSISLDTACSSSLVAVHLACESLQRGESSLALAGGVNLMLVPFGFVSLCELHALAKDGRCKTFDADGDGYGRGEGCGVVVLKRLSDALRDKDPILAVIKGTGVNQDGPGSGLTVPNGKAQKALILKTLEVANVSPADIGYLEVHGTGTALGDPIEFQALTEVFGKEQKRDSPLIVGSVKSNIGHLEASAGVASLIKAVLCLQHKQIPPNLHLHNINPKIHLERIPAIVPQKVHSWETAGKPRMLGISSFGFSGTNAHAIVSEWPASPDEALHSSCERPWHILPLSAKDEQALSQVIVRYSQHIENTSEELLENICFTASTGRSQFPRRIAFVADSMEQMKNTIADYLRGNAGPGVLEGKSRDRTPPKIAFLIEGKINQKLAQSLFETQPIFQKTIRSCHEQLQQLANLSLLEKSVVGERIRGNTAGLLDDILTFALHLSMLKVWEAWGVKPHAVLLQYPTTDRGNKANQISPPAKPSVDDSNRTTPNGSSGNALGSKSGGLVAACAAGIMTMETAFDFILEHWGMAGKAAGKKALHAPQIRVISGRTGKPIEKQEALSPLYWESVLSGELDGTKGRESLHKLGYIHFLQTGIMDASDSREDLLASSGVHYFPSVTEVDPWRTLTHTLANLYCLGLDIDWSGFEHGYSRSKMILPTYPFQRKYFWCETTSKSLVSQGKTESKKEEADRGRSEADEEQTPLSGEGNLGKETDPRRDRGFECPSEPYPQEKPLSAPANHALAGTIDPFSLPPPKYLPLRGQAPSLQPPSYPYDNPLDGRIINSPIKTKQVEYSLSLDAVPDVKDTHGVLHVGYYLEMLYRAVKQLYHTNAFRIQSIDFLAALMIPDSGAVTLSLTLNTKKSGELDFSFFSHQDDDNWNKHTQGTILLNTTDLSPSVDDDQRSNIISCCTDQYSGEEFYRRVQERGLFLGESVQWLEQVWSREGEALARFGLPRSLKTSDEYALLQYPPTDRGNEENQTSLPTSPDAGYSNRTTPNRSSGFALGVHPGVFEACAQLFHATLSRSTDKDMRYLVTKWEDFACYNRPVDQVLWCHVVLQESPQIKGQLKGRFLLFDQNGTVVAQIRSGVMKGLNKERENALRKALDQSAKVNRRDRDRPYPRESKIIRDLRGLSQDQWRDSLNAYLQQVFALILKMDVNELSIDESLMDLGMDSLVGMEAKTKLEEELDIILPIEQLIVGPSICELTESIVPLLAILPSQIDSLKKDAPLPTYKMDIHSWIVHRKPNPQAKVKLFCFPHGAGGGASLYRGWQALLPDYIEVCPVQLPGKENRVKEKAFTDIREAADVLKQVILPDLDCPYAFYGHSIGALLAYRLAYKLWSEIDNKPGHLFVGAYSSPTILPNPLLSLTREKFKEIGYDDIPDPVSLSSISPERIDQILALITSDEILALTTLASAAGTPLPTSGASGELLRLLLPTTLAELQMVRDCNVVDELLFDIPITAIHGKMDDKVSEPEMNAWRKLTKGPFTLHTLPGDHLFLLENQDQKQLLELISHNLEKYK